MKRYFILALLLGLGVLAPIACNRPVSLTPSPVPTPSATPSPTPTVTPSITNTAAATATNTPTMTLGCQTTGLTVLTGTSNPQQPIAIVLGGGPTPTPVPDWSGVAPPHMGGPLLLQTAVDWSNYIASSNFPGAMTPIPFNPATQALVIVTTLPCSDTYTFNSVCNNGTGIQVNVDDNEGCCGNPIAPTLAYDSIRALVITTYGLPVVLNVTYHPYTGMPCV